jgi:hypothetical protein
MRRIISLQMRSTKLISFRRQGIPGTVILYAIVVLAVWMGTWVYADVPLFGPWGTGLILSFALVAGVVIFASQIAWWIALIGGVGLLVGGLAAPLEPVPIQLAGGVLELFALLSPRTREWIADRKEFGR